MVRSSFAIGDHVIVLSPSSKNCKTYGNTGYVTDFTRKRVTIRLDNFPLYSWKKFYFLPKNLRLMTEEEFEYYRLHHCRVTSTPFT